MPDGHDKKKSLPKRHRRGSFLVDEEKIKKGYPSGTPFPRKNNKGETKKFLFRERRKNRKDARS